MNNQMKILNRKQIDFLKRFGRNDFLKKNFYLTGGTALAAFYLHHRYSEDLDFFSEKEIDILPLNVFFESIRNELSVENIDYQQSFNRNLFFLHYKDGEILKTEFTYYPFTRIENSKEENGVEIDSLLDIGVNKIFTIYQRSQIKDYIDLYCICKSENWSIDELIKKTKVKFDWHIDPIQIGSQFVKIEEIQDMPNMLAETKIKDVKEFFIEEAKKLKPGVI
jgi:predicted nucleotidyltransferase component of viral defense system